MAIIEDKLCFRFRCVMHHFVSCSVSYGLLFCFYVTNPFKSSLLDEKRHVSMRSKFDFECYFAPPVQYDFKIIFLYKVLCFPEVFVSIQTNFHLPVDVQAGIIT
ncbi:unnamed protein product [Arabidopsis halleri]